MMFFKRGLESYLFAQVSTKPPLSSSRHLYLAAAYTWGFKYSSVLFSIVRVCPPHLSQQQR